MNPRHLFRHKSPLKGDLAREAVRRRKSATRRALFAAVESLEEKVLLSVNPIVDENLLPGSPPSQWMITGGGDTTLQGFTTDISANRGGTVSFKVNDRDLAPYRIDIFRMGYYQGNGARLVATIPSSQAVRTVQPAPLKDFTTGLVDAGNWTVSATWNVPADAVSGIYIGVFRREDTGAASATYFVVRDDSSTSDLFFQTSDSTWQAYNMWDGTNSTATSLYLYGGSNPDLQARGKAMAVSYNRPLVVGSWTGGLGDYNDPLHAEYPMVRWLEANGYDVSYTTNVDTARRGDLILNHKVFMSVGHDEYWSLEQRDNVEAARDAGVNLAFFSGNESFWKTRWTSSIDASATPYRTVTTYKESQVRAPVDPLNTAPTYISTGTWRDPLFGAPSDGGRPENAMTGTIYMNDRTDNDLGVSLKVPAEYADLRFWRNTSVAALQPGQVATLGQYVVGYEVDEDVDNGFRPAGLIGMSKTTFNTTSHVIDASGAFVGPGVGNHSITLYRASSGALVFGAGTVQWSWGLDDNHLYPSATSSVDMRQATVNLFADMYVQPGSLQPGLLRASPSTDVAAPFSVITSPSAGWSTSVGSTITITGTAADQGGGVVAGVEVSTDGGRTWHPAVGRGSWSYSWVVDAPGPVKILSRAVDDSGNLEAPGSGVTVAAAYAPTSASGLVAAYNFNAGAGTTLADASGRGNNGTISGATWTTGIFGGALAFNGTSSWVTIANSSALNLTSGMTLEAWVKPTSLSSDWTTLLMKEGGNAPSYGIYATDDAANPPAGFVSTSGMYRSAQGTSSLPVNQWSFLAATYDGSVLRLYVNGTLAASTSVSGAISASSGALRIGGNSVWGEYFNGVIDQVRIYSRPLNQGEIRSDMVTPVGGSAEAAPPTGTITSPAAGATVSGTSTITANVADNVAVASVQYLLDGAPLGAPVVAAPFSLTWDTRRFANGQHALSALVVDMAGNSTTLSGRTIVVANSADTRPPSVRILNPGAGRQGGTLVPTAFADDDRGVVGVQFRLNGANIGPELTSAPYRFAWDSSTVADGAYVLTAVARDAAGNTTTSAPVSITINNARPTAAPAWPLAGAVGVSTAPTPIRAVFDQAVSLTDVTFVVKDALGNPLQGSLAYDPSTRTASFTPQGSLEPSTTYTVQVAALDAAGNPSPPTSWSFTTSSAVVNASLWGASTPPAVLAADDGFSIELGVRFSSTVDGYITGIRFYKGPGNTGTHVGSLWDAQGNRLATATFANETAQGWQQVNFSTPVPIVAGATYTASYFAPNGHYAAESGYFATAFTGGVLRVPANGGVYAYGAQSVFPSDAYQATNYWVSPVFSNALAPSVTTMDPAAGAAGVSTTSPQIRAVFDRAVDPATISFTLKDASGNVVPGALAYDPTTRTATLTISAALTPQTTYTATVAGAKDANGIAMPDPVVWTFTTAEVDTTRPTVVSRTPTPGATMVGVAAPALSVLAGFSEAILPETLSITLTDSAANVIATTVAYDPASHTVGMIANAPLAFGSTYTVHLSGAEDLAGNVMAPISWSFTTGAVVDQVLWDASAVPEVESIDDPLSTQVELGVKFSSEVGGFITGVRFYKGPLNTGTHVAHVWAANDTRQFGACPGCNCGAVCFLGFGGGTLLASATFVNETADGWQEVKFAQPVLVMPGVTYIVSYTAPNGGYASTPNYFSGSGVQAGVLSAPGADNGVFGAAGAFPTQTFNGSNYWVTPVFSNTIADVTPPTIVATAPAAGATSTKRTPVVVATFSEPVDPGTARVQLRDAAGNVIPIEASWSSSSGGSSQFDSVTISPLAPLAYGTTHTVVIEHAADLAGNVMTAPFSWTFNTPALIASATIWPASTTPANPSDPDFNSVELGVRFQADTDGYITGIRFYKGPENTGTHVGSLWDAAGNLLATATFANETAQGWQQVNFNAPVPIVAGATYTASYFAPNGHYSGDPGYFSVSGAGDGAVKALVNGGVYAYGAQSAFPTETFGGANYWVDVVFTNADSDLIAPSIVATTPGANATLISVGAVLTATFDESVQEASIQFLLADSLGNPVPATLSYDPATRRATLTPTHPLNFGASYTATVSGARDLAGNVMASRSWSFATAPAIANATIWPASTTPTILSDPDFNSVELGVRFQADTDGYITGIRFYKGPENTGTHVGNLWDAAGNLLATATFTNETAQGWQQVNFNAPVPIVAGATYTASYFAPNGHYSADSDYFGAGITSGVLQVPANGGVAAYGAQSAFPTETHGGANYWVDVVFGNVLDGVAPTVVATTPGASAVDVPLDAAISASFSKSILSGTLAFVVTNAAGETIPGTIAYNDATRRVVFTPAAPLSKGASYTATVTGAEDLAGNVMAPFSWSFTTTAMNPSAVSVLGFSPSANQTNAPVSAMLSATFSGPIQTSGIQFSLRDSSNQAVAARVAYDPASMTLTLIPNAMLSPSTTYTATLAGVVDLTGTSLAPLSWTFTTAAADVTVPTVVSTTPTAGAAGVGNRPAVMVGFSEDVQLSTVNFAVANPGSQLVAGSLAYDATNQVVSFVPSAPLAYATTYTVTVSGARDLAGNLMAPFAWSFTTSAAPDSTPPTVIAVAPTSGGVVASPFQIITATFSEDVQPDTLVFALHNGSAPIAATIAYDPTTRTVSLRPAAALTPSTNYSVLLSGARDLAGNPMSPYNWSFTTPPAGITSVGLAARTPGQGAAGVPVGSDVTATFTNDILPDTLSFTLKDGSTPVPATVSYDPASRMAILKPTAPLAAGTTYTVGISGVTDAAGNSMAPISWTFTTTAAAAAAVVSSAPGSGATGVPVASNVTAVFSQAVLPGTISFVLRRGSTTIAATTSYDPTTRTAILNPNANLTPGTTYTATLSGARDLFGNTMAPTSWTFTTATADATAPTVTARSPNPNGSNVPTDGVVVATFSENVQPSTISFVLKRGSTTIAATTSYDPATRTVKLVPNSPLSSSTSYTATLSGAKDLQGNTMSSLSWSFTTASSPGTPSVSSRSPAPNDILIATGAKVTATFNTAMSAGTINASNFTLRNASNALVAASVSYNSSTRTATLTPSSPLAPGATYTVTLSGIRSSSNRSLATTSWTFTTAGVADTSAPTVAAQSPSTGDVGIPINTLVTATFNKPVLPSTINFVLRRGSTTVSSAVTYDAASQTVYLDPSTSLAPGTTYTATLSGARDLFGNTMTSTSWSFTTASASDSAEPTVVSRSPGSGASGTPVAWSPSATFNEDVQPNTINFVLRRGSTIVASTISYDAPSRTVTLKPTGDLAPGTTYTLTLSGARDLVGNSMDSTSWTFTTAAASDTTAPTVAARSPDSDASGVSPLSILTAVFSESIQPSTIVFSLRNGSTTIPAAVEYDPNSRTAALRPAAPLAPGTTFTADLSGAKDLAGNVMAPISWTFSTASIDSNAPIITAQNPAPGTATAATMITPSATFDKPIQAAGASFVLSDGSSSLAATTAYDPASRTLTLVPSAPLTPGTTYTLTLSGVKDLFGNVMATASWTFSTAAAGSTAAPPTVLSAGPAAGAANVPLSSDVIVRFDSDVQASTIQLVLKAGSTTIPAIMAYDPATREVVLRPTVNLAPSTVYTVSLSGARNLQGGAMTPVSWTFTTKGVDDASPTLISVSPESGASGVAPGATVTAEFSKQVLSGSIQFTLVDANGSPVAATLTYDPTTRRAVLTPLAPLSSGTTYTATVSGARDQSGNIMATTSWTFTTAAADSFFLQSTATDFRGGSGAGAMVVDDSDGAVQLAPRLLDDFTGAAVGGAWTTNSWSSAPVGAIVAGGVLSLSGGAIMSNQLVQGEAIEGRLAFAAAEYQHFGLATDFNDDNATVWAIFSTLGTSDRLFARVFVRGTMTNVDLGPLPSGFHDYRIQPASGAIQFLVDGVVLTTIAATLPADAPIRAAVSNFAGAATQVDRIRTIAFNTTGTFTSSILDAGAIAAWGEASWTADLPAGTSILIETQSSIDGETWSGWSAVANGGVIASPTGRYLRYRATLTTNDSTTTPSLRTIRLAWS